MICSFPPGGFSSVEVPLLSVCNDLSRGLHLFSVAVVVAAAFVMLPAAAVVSSPSVGVSHQGRDWPDGLLIASRAVRARPGQVSVEGQPRDASKKNLRSPPV